MSRAAMLAAAVFAAGFMCGLLAAGEALVQGKVRNVRVVEDQRGPVSVSQIRGATVTR